MGSQTAWHTSTAGCRTGSTCACSWRESQTSSQKQTPSRGSLPCRYCTLCPDLPGRQRPFPSHVQTLTCRSEVQRGKRETLGLAHWRAESRAAWPQPPQEGTRTVAASGKPTGAWIQDPKCPQTTKRASNHPWLGPCLLSRHGDLQSRAETMVVPNGRGQLWDKSSQGWAPPPLL